jgi:hypothetical protein
MRAAKQIVFRYNGDPATEESDLDMTVTNLLPSKLGGILCGSRALRTDVRCECLVSLLFVMNLHLVN